MNRILPFAVLAVAAFYAGTIALAAPADVDNRVAPDPKDPQYQAKGDQKRTYTFPDTGEAVPYRLYVPSNWNRETRLPLIVVLHGANQSQDMPFERGDGVIPKVAEQRGYIVASVLGYRRNASYNNPFPLVPAAKPSIAAPTEGDAGKAKAAVPAPATAQDNERAEMDVLYVADLVAAEYNTDTSRIYLMGNSTGGGGTWYIGQKYPQRWAAISPSAAPAAPDVFPYDRLKSVPVLIVHGDADQTRSYDASVKMVKLAKEHGVDIDLITVKGGEHTTAWTTVVPQIFDFFEKHRRASLVP